MVLKTKTYFPKTGKDIKWYVVDAEGQILGRLASQIAQVLRGKNDPRYTPHADLGFRVAVVNAEKVRVTGNKPEQKTYFRHSGYPGGDKYRTFNRQMELKPEAIITECRQRDAPEKQSRPPINEGTQSLHGTLSPASSTATGSLNVLTLLAAPPSRSGPTTLENTSSMAIEQFWGTGPP